MFLRFSGLLSKRRTSVILQLLNAPHIFILFCTHLSHHILPFIHCTYQLLYSTLSSLRLPFLCLFVSDLHYGHPAPTYIPSNLSHTYCYLSHIVPSLTVYIIFFLRSFIQTFACSLRQFCLILLFVICRFVFVFLGGKYFFAILTLSKTEDQRRMYAKLAINRDLRSRYITQHELVYPWHNHRRFAPFLFFEYSYRGFILGAIQSLSIGRKTSWQVI
jgi:hypothetical protein